MVIQIITHFCILSLISRVGHFAVKLSYYQSLRRGLIRQLAVKRVRVKESASKSPRQNVQCIVYSS